MGWIYFISTECTQADPAIEITKKLKLIQVNIRVFVNFVVEYIDKALANWLYNANIHFPVHKTKNHFYQMKNYKNTKYLIFFY